MSKLRGKFFATRRSSIACRILSGANVAFFLFATSIATLSTARGDSSQAVLTPIALFTRCYQHVTNLRLPRAHPLRQQVLSGSITPVAACMQVIQEAMLSTTSGTSYGKIKNQGPESQAVLRTFNDFHRSWFPSDRLLTSTDANYNPTTRNLFDESESALFVTRALFAPNVPFSDIVTSGDDLEALRDGSVPALAGGSLNLSTFGGPTFNWTPVQSGNLIGVRSYASDPDQTNYNMNFSLPGYVFGATAPQYIHRNRGGGIIGTTSYIFLNYGRSAYQQMDGGIVMPRRWSRAVYNDLLCRDVPVVRATDATDYVETQTSPATPQFRVQRACMQCHIAMDPFASTIRDVTWDQNSTQNLLMNIPVTMGPESGQVDQDGNFARRPPNGRFIFRSYDGTLIQKNLTNVADGGAALASTQDLYACAASRYLKFFTGVNVTWADIGDPNNSASASQMANDPYRAFAIQLGKDLQKNQNLMSLIQEIISSDLYQKNSMRVSP